MALQLVNQVTVRAERYTEFRLLVEQLALRARTRQDPVEWYAYRTLYGRVKQVHVTSRVEKFADLEGRGDPELLWQRVSGVQTGATEFARVAACIEHIDHCIAVERPDLSHPPEPLPDGLAPFASVSTYKVRCDRIDRFESMLGRIAEAAREAKGAASGRRLFTYQVVYGDLGVYYNVRPLRGIPDMDDALPAQELLMQAHGPEEGRRIWGLGHSAVVSGRRSIVCFTPELSHPSLPA